MSLRIKTPSKIYEADEMILMKEIIIRDNSEVYRLILPAKSVEDCNLVKITAYAFGSDSYLIGNLPKSRISALFDETFFAEGADITDILEKAKFVSRVRDIPADGSVYYSKVNMDPIDVLANQNGNIMIDADRYFCFDSLTNSGYGNDQPFFNESSLIEVEDEDDDDYWEEEEFEEDE